MRIASKIGVVCAALFGAGVGCESGLTTDYTDYTD